MSGEKILSCVDALLLGNVTMSKLPLHFEWIWTSDGFLEIQYRIRRCICWWGNPVGRVSGMCHVINSLFSFILLRGFFKSQPKFTAFAQGICDVAWCILLLGMLFYLHGSVFRILNEIRVPTTNLISWSSPVRNWSLWSDNIRFCYNIYWDYRTLGKSFIDMFQLLQHCNEQLQNDFEIFFKKYSSENRQVWKIYFEKLHQANIRSHT